MCQCAFLAVHKSDGLKNTQLLSGCKCTTASVRGEITESPTKSKRDISERESSWDVHLLAQFKASSDSSISFC